MLPNNHFSSKCFVSPGQSSTFAPTEPATLPEDQRTRAGRFIYRAMKYNKQPISIDDQITILKGRGLIFDDEQNAHSVLENISYFRLAGYWRTMEQNSSIHHPCHVLHHRTCLHSYRLKLQC